MLFAFDLFNTLVEIPKSEHKALRRYAGYIDLYKREEASWLPLELPPTWSALQVFDDVLPGFQKLRDGGHKLCPLTNCPHSTLVNIGTNNGLWWDRLFSLDFYQVYKPNPYAYKVFLQDLNADPKEVVMVTANKDFGDLEAAEQLGMESYLLDRKEERTVITMAEEYAGR